MPDPLSGTASECKNENDPTLSKGKHLDDLPFRSGLPRTMSGDELNAQITKVGDEIREMKTAKAAKEDVMAKVRSPALSGHRRRT